MIPGRKECYDGWAKEYTGYLLAGHPTHKVASEYICIDGKPDFKTKTTSWKHISLIHSVQDRCKGGTSYPPYSDGGEMVCVFVQYETYQQERFPMQVKKFWHLKNSCVTTCRVVWNVYIKFYINQLIFLVFILSLGLRHICKTFQDLLKFFQKLHLIKIYMYFNGTRSVMKIKCNYLCIWTHTFCTCKWPFFRKCKQN